MRLVAKLGFDKRQFRFGRRGAVVFLIFWVFLFSGSFVLALSGTADRSTFSILFVYATLILFTIAEFLHDTALNLAVLLRSVGALAWLVGMYFLATDIYLRSGPLWAAVVTGLFVLGISVAIYLQRRQRTRLTDNGRGILHFL